MKSIDERTSRPSFHWRTSSGRSDVASLLCFACDGWTRLTLSIASFDAWYDSEDVSDGDATDDDADDGVAGKSASSFAALHDCEGGGEAAGKEANDTGGSSASDGVDGADDAIVN